MSIYSTPHRRCQALATNREALAAVGERADGVGAMDDQDEELLVAVLEKGDAGLHAAKLRRDVLMNGVVDQQAAA